MNGQARDEPPCGTVTSTGPSGTLMLWMPVSAHGRFMVLLRSALAAGIAAAQGRKGEALSAYRVALRGLRELRVDFFEALTCLDMVILIGPGEPEVDAAAERAREILTGLRATPYLQILDDALERAGSHGSRVGAKATPSTESVRDQLINDGLGSWPGVPVRAP